MTLGSQMDLLKALRLTRGASLATCDVPRDIDDLVSHRAAGLLLCCRLLQFYPVTIML